jgi:hypothetical protein
MHSEYQISKKIVWKSLPFTKKTLHLPWIHETLQFEYSYLNPERNKNEKGWTGEDKKH